MILCGNVYVDELKNTFFLCCILCKKKSRRYTEFTSHIKAKHKDISDKETTTAPSSQRQIVKKIKDEDSDDDNEDDECDGIDKEEMEEAKPEVDIKDEMDVDALEQFADDIKYDVQEIEPYIDPILASGEKDSANASDLLNVGDEDIKDEDYAFDDADNDDSEDEDYRDDGDDDNDNGADSDSDVNEIPVTTDKFTPTFYRKKRYVNDFIELYKSQPVLWDINDPLFENPKAHKEAEQAIINGMQKFNIFLKPTALKAAINRIHKYCEIIKSDLDNGDAKKITSIAKGYYEKCDFLKDLLAKKATPETDKQNNPLILDQWDETTSKFIDILEKFPILYDKNHPLHGKLEDEQKALSEMQSTLLKQHNVDFNEIVISNAILQLKLWYFRTKRRKGKLSKYHEKYFKMCKFIPGKLMKEKILCSICEKVFYTEHNLKHHLSKAHNIGNFSFKCDICGKELVSKTAVQYHNLRVHAEKKYPCEFCGKLYAIPSELKVHIRVHTAEKPHVCELCGKCFRLRNLLGLHVTRMHTKVRAFKCTMCPKDFFQNTDLRDHMKTHLNIRDKICETCGKGFTNCHSLIRHRQIHSEVKKFECKLCDAKFHQFVGLNGHMKRTHNIVKKD
ncbi:uncharacterized protein ACRADG_011102 isoform 4-T4 [Cochliomyia hominivorax]